MWAILSLLKIYMKNYLRLFFSTYNRRRERLQIVRILATILLEEEM